MNFRRFLQNSSSGFTLLELLVAMSLGLVIIGLGLSTALTSKNIYSLDIVRTRINQDIRGALDFIGSEVRIAGENFPSSFPAIMTVDGGGVNPDQLILRRNLLDESLKVCVDKLSGSADMTLVFSKVGSSESGCTYPSAPDEGAAIKFAEWNAYRDSQDPKIVDHTYIFNRSTRLGEWFNYSSETDSGTELFIQRQGGGWSNDYTVGTSAVYVMEEWKLLLNGQTLQLILNNDSANPYNVAFGIEEFQVRALLQDGSSVDTFDSSENWKQLRAIEITMEGSESFKGNIIEGNLTAQFFPRNVLSMD